MLPPEMQDGAPVAQCPSPEASDQECDVVRLTRVFEDTENLPYLRLITPGSDSKELDYLLVCASRDQNGTEHLDLDGLLSQLNFTVDRVPFIGGHKH